MDLALSHATHLHALLVGALFALILGLGLRRPTWGAVACGATLTISGALALYALIAADSQAPGLDRAHLNGWTTLLLLTGTALSLLLFRLCRPLPRPPLYALMVLATLGCVLLASASDMVMLLLAALIIGVGGSALLSRPDSRTAALPFFAAQCVAVGALAYGLVLLYGSSGTTSLHDLSTRLSPRSEELLWLASALITAGLGFFAGIVPLHGWLAATATRGTPGATAFLAVVPRLAALIALVRIGQSLDASGYAFDGLLAGAAAVTMTWGNWRALREDNLQRLLAHSATAHTGYLLLGCVAASHSPLALPSLLFAFGAYAVAHVGAMAAVSASGCNRMGDQLGLASAHPGAAIALLLAVLSLASVPPLAGFVGKFGLLLGAAEAGFGWLALLALINTLVALFYYLRLILPMFLSPEQPFDALPVAPRVAWFAIACALCTLAVGLASSFLLVELSTRFAAG